ncbi:hypothetical protein Aph01nite_06680 [Acrocarpospora phusangensis]|uniref:O-antigen ligase-related domain-containing protein n=1 Tax=Acrocarpospora phusangensis TaxID=1070424 RepID=A0A919Q5J9_9ACTN|nr:O-antigen ligase family protein [Acrocarpospora phusangensis]GIH22358.1 hypothetical protein Aph01nite_06680 [Acrocarpospora phusangensis]
MTVTDLPDALPGSGPRQRADGATLTAFFVIALTIIPARLVLKGLPLSLTPANLIALTLGLIWLLAHLSVGLGMAKGRAPVRTALFVYLTAMLCTYGYSTWGYLPADELNLTDHALVLILANVGLALFVNDGVRGVDRLNLLLKTLVVAGAALSVIGAFQFLLAWDPTRLLELPILRYTSEDSFVLERAEFRRVAATTGHPIEFGVVCAMLLPLAAHYGFRARMLGEAQWRWWTCAALIGAGLMFSVSRSAMLGIIGVGVILFFGWPAQRRKMVILVSLGFLVLMRLLVPGLVSAIWGLFANFGSDDSIRYRLHDYVIAGHEISKHFWLGRGVSTWYAPKHQVFDNQYILSTLEAGVIGVTTIVVMFLVAMYSGLRARFLSTDPATRDLGLTLTACLVVPLIGAATFDLLSFATITGLSFLVIGATGSLLRSVRAGSPADPPYV